MATKKVECPSCDGWGDHGYDEDGCRYVCYGCGGTGWVDPDDIEVEPVPEVVAVPAAEFEDLPF